MIRSLTMTLLVAAACAGCRDERAAAAPDAPSPVSAATLALEPCTVPGSEEAVRCARLSVPEDHATPGGRQVSLNIVVIPALDPRPGYAPLYELAGGPGLAASDGASFYLTIGAVHRRHRDIVLVDQRGTGRSAPLACPELAGTGAEFPDDEVRACRQRLAAIADLARYTTADAVRDLRAVRAALGHGPVDLFGLSYGTRLALAWIAAEPQAIRSAILVGTVPDDARVPLWHARHAQEALDQVFADCRADRACAAVYRDLPARWNALLQRDDFDGAARETFRNVLMSTPGQRRVPALVSRIAADGPPDAPPPASDLADGLFLSVTCAEDTGFIDEAQIAAATADTFAGDHRVRRQLAACAIWDVPRVALAYARAPSTVPVLFIAGGRDHVTPVRWAERVASAFPRGRVVTIPALGHFPDGLANMGCLDTLIEDIARRADPAAIDIACVQTMTPPAFAGPYARD